MKNLLTGAVCGQEALHHLELWSASQAQRQQQLLTVWQLQIRLLSTALPCQRLQGPSKPLQPQPALGQGCLGSLQHPPAHLLEVQLLFTSSLLLVFDLSLQFTRVLLVLSSTLLKKKRKNNNHNNDNGNDNDNNTNNSRESCWNCVETEEEEEFH